jgi:hypothetical protein
MVESTILTFWLCVFYFLTLNRVLDILVLAGIQHLVDFSRLLQVSQWMPYQEPNKQNINYIRMEKLALIFAKNDQLLI